MCLTDGISDEEAIKLIALDPIDSVAITATPAAPERKRKGIAAAAGGDSWKQGSSGGAETLSLSSAPAAKKADPFEELLSSLDVCVVACLHLLRLPASHICRVCVCAVQSVNAEAPLQVSAETLRALHPNEVCLSRCSAVPMCACDACCCCALLACRCSFVDGPTPRCQCNSSRT